MKKDAKRFVALALVILMMLGVAVSALSGLVPEAPAAGNTAHLMEAGLPRDKADILAAELADIGAGELIGVSPYDTGEGWDVTMYDETSEWYALLDYEGNLLEIGRQGLDLTGE